MSNQEAIKTLYEYRHCFWDKLYEPICMAIKSLEQESKVGHWIEHEIEDTLRWLECSNCHCETYNVKHNFCPNCGCAMFKTQESEAEDGNNN